MPTAVKKPPAPQLKSTKRNPFPSAPQATRTVRSAGGPQLVTPRPVKNNKPVGIPGKVGPSHPMRIIRNEKMGRRVGVPRIWLRGTKTVARTKQARSNLRTATGRRVIDPAGPRKIIKTKGKTRIIGKNKTLTVTAGGSRIVNKKAHTVVRQKFTGGPKNPGGSSKIIKRWGVGTATKADDARAVKIRGPKKAVFRYKKGKSGLVVRRAPGSPRKLRVRIINDGKVTRKVIGPKQTTRTGPGGKSKTYKTRYISPERRKNVTPEPGQKGWRRGNTKPRSNVPKRPHKPGGNVPRRPHVTGTKARGNWKNVKKFRRLRRRQGARFNQSVTKGQLKAVTSRRLS